MPSCYRYRYRCRYRYRWIAYTGLPARAGTARGYRYRDGIASWEWGQTRGSRWSCRDLERCGSSPAAAVIAGDHVDGRRAQNVDERHVPAHVCVVGLGAGARFAVELSAR